MAASFVAFGTPDFNRARVEHRRSIEGYGYPVHSFDIDSEPIRLAREENPEIFRYPRGYGYWIWKPYIIEAVLGALAPGALLFYTDIATTMVSPPQLLFDITKDLDIVLFRAGIGYYQREYTKRDAFVLMHADEPRHWDDEQMHGGFLIVRNCDAGRKFVGEWKSYLRDPRIVTDKPNEMGLPNFPEFVDHRHDQSALSILAIRENIPFFRDPSQWGNESRDIKVSDRFNPIDFGQIFFRHRRRDHDYERFA